MKLKIESLFILYLSFPTSKYMLSYLVSLHLYVFTVLFIYVILISLWIGQVLACALHGCKSIVWTLWSCRPWTYQVFLLFLADIACAAYLSMIVICHVKILY